MRLVPKFAVRHRDRGHSCYVETRWRQRRPMPSAFRAPVWPGSCAATVDAIRSFGGVANFSHLDVRNSAQVAELVRNSHPATGGLDVLVYCAGVFDNMVGCLDTSEDLWDQLMNINLKGCFLANKAALEIMVPRR
jgi:NAD(P)-dependent dehydrogenase (short-subunit alcohol dehydrogenase family)